MSMSEVNIRLQYDKEDPYLLFSGPVCDITPKEFISLIDTIRKKSDWLNTSLPIKKDRKGDFKTIIKKGLYFEFVTLVGYGTDVLELKAIETGKKCTKNPKNISALISQGCSYEDFAFVSSDIKAYCEAILLLDNKNLQEALLQAKEAHRLKPDKNEYANLFFEIGLLLEDESTIYDEFNYYENDINSSIHTGRVYKWIRLLTQHKKSNEALGLIYRIDELLDDLISGRRQNKRYGGKPERYSREEWYGLYKEKFNKKIEKTKLRLEKHKNNKNSTYETMF